MVRIFMNQTLSNTLEQLEFKLEKISGFRNMQEKLENICTSKWAGIRFFVRAVVGQQFEPKTRGYFHRENLDL